MICCGDGAWHEGFYTLNISDKIKYGWVGGQPHRGRRGQPGGEDHGVKGETLSRLDYAIMWPQPSYQLLRKTQWIYNRHFIIRYYEQTETRRCKTLDSASDKNCHFLPHFYQVERRRHILAGVQRQYKVLVQEVADIRMYHFGWNFLQKGFDMTSQWWWLIRKLFILWTCLTTLKSCMLVVDDTVDGKNN